MLNALKKSLVSSVTRDVDPIELQVFLARLAEQAMCFSEMLEYVKPIMELKGPCMTFEERMLI